MLILVWCQILSSRTKFIIGPTRLILLAILVCVVYMQTRLLCHMYTRLHFAVYLHTYFLTHVHAYFVTYIHACFATHVYTYFLTHVHTYSHMYYLSWNSDWSLLTVVWEKES